MLLLLKTVKIEAEGGFVRGYHGGVDWLRTEKQSWLHSSGNAIGGVPGERRAQGRKRGDRKGAAARVDVQIYVF